MAYMLRCALEKGVHRLGPPGERLAHLAEKAVIQRGNPCGVLRQGKGEHQAALPLMGAQLGAEGLHLLPGLRLVAEVGRGENLSKVKSKPPAKPEA